MQDYLQLRKLKSKGARGGDEAYKGKKTSK